MGGLGGEPLRRRRRARRQRGYRPKAMSSVLGFGPPLAAVATKAASEDTR
jgi:hypothetical protein